MTVNDIKDAAKNDPSKVKVEGAADGKVNIIIDGKEVAKGVDKKVAEEMVGKGGSSGVICG